MSIVALDIFCGAGGVTSGLSKAGVRVALGIDNDGQWGPQTQAAATLAQMDLVAHIERFTSRRIEVYKESKGYQYFGTDWVRRATQIGDAMLAMAAEAIS